jgi:hypothetical protein
MVLMNIRFVGVKSARETVNAFGLVAFPKILWRALFYHSDIDSKALVPERFLSGFGVAAVPLSDNRVDRRTCL